jgi:hypothetical protein
MITPAPTSKIAPNLARGVVEEIVPDTATKPGYLVVSFPDTSYKTHLRPTAQIRTPLGKRIVGTVRAKIRRLDVVGSGGRYLEPVEGRPRRLQGWVTERDEQANTVTVNAGIPVICVLTDLRQRAAQFQAGQFVSCDVFDGASFTPAP